METTGGLIHGRGVSERVLTRWTMGMTSLHAKKWKILEVHPLQLPNSIWIRETQECSGTMMI